jgi:hypothetical protein
LKAKKEKKKTITRCTAILKTRTPISCAYTHPLCVVRQKNKEKTMRKMKKEKKCQPNPLTHVNPTFLPIGP